MNLIAANWKMNKTVKEALKFFNDLNSKTDEFADNEVLICPSFLALSEISKIKHEKIKLGAQNFYFEDSGAYTGETSLLILKGFCEYVLVGHSERRSIFKEPNQLVNKKVLAALNHHFKPILCIGETGDERQKNKTNEVLSQQLKACLKGVSENQIKNLVVAYEPVWAIGTGKNATSAMAQEVHEFIREVLTDMYSQTTARQLKLLYGGSVKPDNAKDLIAQEDINGFLIGGASLEVESFVEIINAAK